MLFRSPKAAIHDKLDFQVIEFSSANKRIVLAHTPTWQKAKNSPSKGQHTHSTDNSVALDKTTLGGIDALAMLKEQLAENNNNQPEESC